LADPGVVLAGRETILRDGRPVGYLTSAGWGYTIGANIGLGYVRHRDGVTDEWLASGQYELEVATERVDATLHLDALYDPANVRVRA
jgi:4-methylaminobutanoate oxidase (formaldehyde-forming)